MQTTQLALTGLLPAAEPAAADGPASQDQQQAALPAPTVQQDGSGVTISGSGGWELRFDAASGSLASWAGSGGRQLLAAPLAPCFYRAPTDNDKGGSGGSSYAARWAGWAGQVPGCQLLARVGPLLHPCRLSQLSLFD